MALLDRPDLRLLDTLGFGWPFTALASDYLMVPIDQGMVRTVIGIPIPRLDPADAAIGPIPRTIPTRPIWPGLVGNWLIASVAVLIAWCTLQTLARALTGRRRGWRWDVCPGCGYHVEGLDTCPECGEQRPVRRRGKAADTIARDAGGNA